MVGGSVSTLLLLHSYVPLAFIFIIGSFAKFSPLNRPSSFSHLQYSFPLLTLQVEEKSERQHDTERREMRSENNGYVLEKGKKK